MDLTPFDQWVAGGEMSLLSGRRIFQRQDGPADGTPVTLIHGFPTSSHDWEPVMGTLIGAGCRVTVLDLLGFGASEKPGGHRFAMAEQADIVEALWSQLGIGDTALVAHDYGVTVAQELLARDSARITRMAFLNGGLYADLHRPVVVQRLLHGPAGVVLGPLGSETLFRRTLRQIFGRPVSDATLHEMWLATSGGGGRMVQHALLRYIDERRAFAGRWQAALEHYPGPLMFVWGPADPISGAHVLVRLRATVPRAEFVELDQAPATGHYPQLENPEAVGAALSRFLTATA